VNISEKNVIMAYLCELGPGHNIYLENQGPQTIITSIVSSLGQQQQSSINVRTGNWTVLPEIYRMPHGAILKITTAQGEHFIQVQGSSMSSMTSAPSFSGSQQMQMTQIAEMPVTSSIPPMEPMQPIPPMQPMKMGNMEMGMNPMEMRMGNMHLSMGSVSEPMKAKARRFCSQCGSATKQEDRFCSSCGNKLA
jgi:NADH pyrophosphatase NudC (nudix superfamily)